MIIIIIINNDNNNNNLYFTRVTQSNKGMRILPFMLHVTG